MNDYATRVLESLARATWERIKFGEELDCSQGEETMTDVNLLDLKRAGPHAVHVFKVNKADEAKYGIDWEWWIGTDSDAFFGGWWRYAVQAKKLNSSGHYGTLRHKVGGRYQFDILGEYALKNRCVPLYCFYNFYKGPTKPYWHCCEGPEEPPQMGCTVAPLDAVAPVFRKGASKKFEDVHRDVRALPWRCLLKCMQLLPLLGRTQHPLAGGAFGKFSTYDRIPFRLWGSPGSQTVKGFPADFYDRDLGIYPKRIMVIDISPAATLG
jgi:hypothetical protein